MLRGTWRALASLLSTPGEKHLLAGAAPQAETLLSPAGLWGATLLPWPGAGFIHLWGFLETGPVSTHLGV